MEVCGGILICGLVVFVVVAVATEDSLSGSRDGNALANLAMFFEAMLVMYGMLVWAWVCGSKSADETFNKAVEMMARAKTTMSDSRAIANDALAEKHKAEQSALKANQVVTATLTASHLKAIEITTRVTARRQNCGRLCGGEVSWRTAGGVRESPCRSHWQAIKAVAACRTMGTSAAPYRGPTSRTLWRPLSRQDEEGLWVLSVRLTAYRRPSRPHHPEEARWAEHRGQHPGTVFLLQCECGCQVRGGRSMSDCALSRV